ncbi:MAG: hypothetical protein AAGM22_33640 [Acidobacteriota bacterium]
MKALTVVGLVAMAVPAAAAAAAEVMSQASGLEFGELYEKSILGAILAAVLLGVFLLLREIVSKFGKRLKSLEDSIYVSATVTNSLAGRLSDFAQLAAAIDPDGPTDTKNKQLSGYYARAALENERIRQLLELKLRAEE